MAIQREAMLEVSGKGPVRLRVVHLDSTTAAMEIGVDYSQAPVPNLSYDADFCDVVQGRPDISLVFGKLKAGSNALRTKIEITFSNEYFYRQLWRNTRGLHRSIDSLAKGEYLAPIELTGDTEKVQCLRANNVYMAVLGGEAVLDFYYISPGDVHQAQNKQRKEISLDAVVRVVVSLQLLLEFLNKCAPYGERLKARFAEEES